MKISRKNVAIVVNFQPAQIPVFRQARREIDEELKQRGLNAADALLLDQVELDRYAMELTNKLLTKASEQMSDTADVMNETELDQESIDCIVDECWRAIWEHECDPENLFGISFAVTRAAGTPIFIAGTHTTLYPDDPRPDA